MTRSTPGPIIIFLLLGNRLGVLGELAVGCMVENSHRMFRNDRARRSVFDKDGDPQG